MVKQTCTFRNSTPAVHGKTEHHIIGTMLQTNMRCSSSLLPLHHFFSKRRSWYFPYVAMEPFSLVVPTSFFHYCVMEFFSIHSFPGVAVATFVFRQCYFVWVQWLWRSFALEVTNSFGYFLFYPRANAAAAAAKRVMERNLNYIFHVCKSDKRPAAEACFFSSCFPLPCVLGCHCCIYIHHTVLP